MTVKYFLSGEESGREARGKNRFVDLENLGSRAQDTCVNSMKGDNKELLKKIYSIGCTTHPNVQSGEYVQRKWKGRITLLFT